MIRNFRDEDTEALWNRKRVAKFQAFERVALRKLAMIHAAERLSDLRVPPNNKLEKLKKDRKGQHSIRINDQYRVCFVWNNGAENVQITDSH